MLQSGMELKRSTFGVENWVDQNSQRAGAGSIAVFPVAWHPNFHMI